MSLIHILVFVAAALLFSGVLQGRWRGWVLLGISLVALYWLQPSTPIRHLDYWLATASVVLTSWVWVTTRNRSEETQRADRITVIFTAALLLGIGALRYLGPMCCLTPSRPPVIWEIAAALLLCGAAGWTIARFGQGKAAWVVGLTVLLLAAFLVLKTGFLTNAASIGLRSLTGQSAQLASALDIRWLGFSYIAFRLLHVLRDRQSGKTYDLSLQEFIVYVLFFATLPAGPIDRAPRFVQDLRKPFRLAYDDLLAGGGRLVWGIFKKFVLADTLALIALTDVSALQTQTTPWLWVIVYAYSLRIYFDFSGYTDIALGLGRLFGIQLPENFDRPYLKLNLTLFWNSWHMTLAQWFRAYYFNPVTRFLRTGKKPWPLPAIIFIGQLGTMLLIGLWHGVTWNFVLWGLWHGLGMFIHNRWSDFLKVRLDGRILSPASQRWLAAGGVLFTFHFVTLGWVWFALSSPAASWKVLLGLVGIHL